jgi:hypothetical protein
MTDLKSLLNVPFCEARSLMADEIEMCRENVIADVRAARLSAANRFRESKSPAEFAAALAELNATLAELNATLQRLRTIAGAYKTQLQHGVWQ